MSNTYTTESNTMNMESSFNLQEILDQLSHTPKQEDIASESVPRNRHGEAYGFSTTPDEDFSVPSSKKNIHSISSLSSGFIQKKEESLANPQNSSNKIFEVVSEEKIEKKIVHLEELLSDDEEVIVECRSRIKKIIKLSQIKLAYKKIKKQNMGRPRADRRKQRVRDLIMHGQEQLNSIDFNLMALGNQIHVFSDLVQISNDIREAEFDEELRDLSSSK